MNTFTRNKEKYESSIRAISVTCSRVLKESKRTMNQVSDSGACSRLLIHFEKTLEQGSLSKPVKKSSVTQVGIPKLWIPWSPYQIWGSSWKTKSRHKNCLTTPMSYSNSDKVISHHNLPFPFQTQKRLREEKWPSGTKNQYSLPHA